MGQLIVNNSGGIPEIDEGTYLARFAAYEKTESKFDQKPQYAMDYQIVKGEYKGVTLKRWVNRKENSDGTISVHTMSTLYKDLCALNGVKDLAVGSTAELDDLIGTLVLIEIRENQEGKPKIKEVRRVPASQLKAFQGSDDEDDDDI